MPYSAGMRFGDEKGTNPEELLAAAHAGCFNMALAFGLSGAGHAAGGAAHDRRGEDRAGRRRLHDQDDRADAARAACRACREEEFKKAAEDAKAGCPVSKLFKGAEITLDAQLTR